MATEVPSKAKATPAKKVKDVEGSLFRKARNDLAVFCQSLDRKFEVPAHVSDLTDLLECVESGVERRVIVMQPPRHGKSQLISQLFPCWFLGRNPTAQVIQTGYGSDIALYHSRRARDYFSCARFHRIFPGVLHAPERPAQEVVEVSRQAAHEWGTRQGGRYYAVGVGGGITGRGADLAIIDDPIKNREEANSPTARRKILDWYRSTLYTRLSPEGRIVLVMTRWHKHDLAGTLLDEMKEGDGDKWTIVRCRAIDESGNALWPERWPVERLLKIKIAIGSGDWSALYQQEPRDAESGMLRREWFAKIIDQAPAGIQWTRYWDLAATEAEGTNDPDWTAGALVGEREGIWYIADIRNVQFTPYKVEKLIEQTLALDPRFTKIRMEQEGGASGKSLVDAYARGMMLGRDFKGIPSLKNKVIRAGPLSAAAEAGNVVLVRGDWNRSFLEQAEVFPSGDHDDMIDAVTGAMNDIAAKTPAGSSRVKQARGDGVHNAASRVLV